jgi:hypothetical protein
MPCTYYAISQRIHYSFQLKRHLLQQIIMIFKSNCTTLFKVAVSLMKDQSIENVCSIVYVCNTSISNLRLHE